MSVDRLLSVFRPGQGRSGLPLGAALLAILLLVVQMSALISGADAQAAPVRVDAVQVELVADRSTVVPGERFQIGLHIIHDEGWHTYWRNPGDSGLPTQFPVKAPAGFQVGDITWPVPARFLIPPLANIGYDAEVMLVRDVQVPTDAPPGKITINTLAQWLVCRDVCIPGEAELALDLMVGASAELDATRKHLFDRTNQPQPQNAAPVQMADGKLRLLVSDALTGMRTSPPHLEFFPFEPGVISHAAPQLIYRPPGRDAWVLEVALDETAVGTTGGTGSDTAAAASLARADGLLVVDATRGVQMIAQRADDPAFANLGPPVATIEGEVVPVFAQRQSAASGLLAAASASFAGGTVTGNPLGNGVTLAPAAAAGASAVGGSLLVAMTFAAIGGLILNLMPCVFPVIGLKILGFAGGGSVDAGGPGSAARRAIRMGSFWFAAGVVVSFVALASLLLMLRAAGESIGWGFQLQSPVFVVLMALLFVAIGLNLSGVFEFGLSLTRLGNLDKTTAPPPSVASDSRDSVVHGWRSFASGALAVLVATPCTAPFMGSALGYTLAQPALNTLAVFVALGLGMALPYIALGLAPGWLRWLPRPGPWMETLRQFLAFPMYAAAIWLGWVLGRQAGLDAMLALALAAVLMALSFWMWGRLVQANRAGSRRLWAVVAAGVLAIAVVVAWPTDRMPLAGAQQHEGWTNWEPGAVERELAKGRTVFLDFTAAWCISCQVNERLVLARESVQSAFKAGNVVAMRADWTQRDPRITTELARHGRNSVPLYLVYRPGLSEPIVLPELLTESVVLQALH